MLKLIHNMKIRNERGFTLIELIVVVTIIAILTAIATFQFIAFRESAIRASMVADARNIERGVEAFFVDNQTYVGLVGGYTGPGIFDIDGGAVANNIALSANNALAFPTATATTWILTITNPAAGAGMNPLTLTSEGICTWANGTNC